MAVEMFCSGGLAACSTALALGNGVQEVRNARARGRKRERESPGLNEGLREGQWQDTIERTRRRESSYRDIAQHNIIGPLERPF